MLALITFICTIFLSKNTKNTRLFHETIERFIILIASKNETETFTPIQFQAKPWAKATECLQTPQSTLTGLHNAYDDALLFFLAV